jgi:hypothetical protein
MPFLQSGFSCQKGKNSANKAQKLSQNPEFKVCDGRFFHERNKLLKSG